MDFVWYLEQILEVCGPAILRTFFFPFWLKFFEKIKLGTSSKVYLFLSCFHFSNVGSSFCGFERASLSVLAQGVFGLVLQSVNPLTLHMAHLYLLLLI